VRAIKERLRIQELPVPYYQRSAGKSKISRTISGTFKAGSTILWVIGRELAHEQRRSKHQNITPDNRITAGASS
jgi:hypothetical protein